MNEIDKPEEFEKLRTIGKGAFGTATLYKRLGDNQHIVLKDIFIQEMDDDEIRQTMMEVKILSSLSHPNIINYIGKFQQEGFLIIMMEYADGGNLSQSIKETKKMQEVFSELKILSFLSDITCAVSYMHKRKVLHRDLKTANIFLMRNGVVKIGDFGISKILSNTKLQAQTVIGTPCYLSPEMCEGSGYNEKSDIWALGCILYEMACLRKPFEAPTLPILVQKIKRCEFETIPRIYSEGLFQLVRLLLQKEQSKRPSAEEIHNNLIPQLLGDLQNLEECNVSASSMIDNDSNQRSVLYAIEGIFENLNLIPVPLPNKKILDVCFSRSHSAALLPDNLVYTWGDDKYGQLAHGNIASFRRFPVCVNYLRGKNIIKCALGDGFSIFLNGNGVVYSCGYGGKGCLGHGDWNNVVCPTIISSILTVNIIQISCGSDHVLALSADGTLYSWGSSKHGQLGNGHNQYCCTPKSIDFKFKIKAIYTGYDNSAILTTHGKVFGCGSNEFNKLDLRETICVTKFVMLPNISQTINRVYLGACHTMIVTESGNVICMGRNIEGQTGHSNHLNNRRLQRMSIQRTKIISVACGLTYTVALSNENVVYFWGTHFAEDSRTRNYNELRNDNALFSEKQQGGESNKIEDKKMQFVHKPKPILALYASQQNKINNNFLWLHDLYTVENKLYILVHTTVPSVVSSTRS